MKRAEGPDMGKRGPTLKKNACGDAMFVIGNSHYIDMESM